MLFLNNTNINDFSFPISLNIFSNFMKLSYLLCSIETKYFIFKFFKIFLFWPASHHGGFSGCGAWALSAWASVVVAYGLSSCGTQAQ